MEMKLGCSKKKASSKLSGLFEGEGGICAEGDQSDLAILGAPYVDGVG